MKFSSCFAILALAVLQPLFGAEDAVALKASQLKPQQGAIVLKDGLATIHLPAGLGYLDPAQTGVLLHEIWGNPGGDETLGMIVPLERSPLTEAYWGVVVTFDDDGYVSDTDAEKIDYSKLLKEMQKGTLEANTERAKKGYPAVELVGWAEPPSYDHAAKKMFWAKELKFGEGEEHTLNYNIRVLGRRGVLVLNAVGGMNQLAEIKAASPEIVQGVEFNQGHRYADYDAKVDKLAAYGIAALITGGVAAKAGLFKALLVALLAAKKFIVLGVIAAGSAIAKFFRKKDPAA